LLLVKLLEEIAKRSGAEAQDSEGQNRAVARYKFADFHGFPRVFGFGGRIKHCPRKFRNCAGRGPWVRVMQGSIQ
jgi:hypothetical protein